MNASPELGRWAAAHRANVPPFHVMDLMAALSQRAADGLPVLNLLAGQPATGAPSPVVHRAMAALHSGDPLGYTPADGLPQLREAIAAHYHRDGLTVHADDVVVTTGSSGGFLLAFLAAFEVGDRVAIARPGYPCYRNVLQALGCQVVQLPTGAETRYQPTLEQVIEAAQHPDGLQGLIVASPANPTGTVLAAAELTRISQWCEQHGVQLISDEIYHGLEYGPQHGVPDAPHRAVSAWQVGRRSLVFGSFSKYFSMTGWRLGWLLVPEHLRRAVHVLTGNFTICPPALAQHAAVAAFEPASLAELDAHVHRYAATRGLLLRELPALGITRLAPADGAFYVYADIAHLTDDSLAWCHQVLQRTGVALAPGIDFDDVDGRHTVRFSAAGPVAQAEQGLHLLAPLLQEGC